MWLLMIFCAHCNALPSISPYHSPLTAAACEQAAEHMQPLLHGTHWEVTCVPHAWAAIGPIPPRTTPSTQQRRRR